MSDEAEAGLLNRDLADRFSISESLCIFHCWLRAMALYLQSFARYMPDIGTINVTSPKRFHQYRNLIGIIDCSEVFIETPKIWSYKVQHGQITNTTIL